MPERSFDAVIFDMDGVLVDTVGVYERHWRAWATRNGIDAEAPIAVHHGRPAVETMALVAPHLDAAAEATAFNGRLAEDPDANGVVALDGAVDLLRSLPAGTWTIATSAPGVMARRWLEQLGFPTPAELVTVEDVARGKPAPDPYLRAARLLGVDARRCLVIEDAPAGITAAKSAGATVLAVLTTHEPSEVGQADAVIRGLSNVSIEPLPAGILASWTAAQTP